MIIMMQVKYDLTFDKAYPAADKIYQLDQKRGPGEKYDAYFARAQARECFGSSHWIKESALRTDDVEYGIYDPDKGASTMVLERSFIASESFPKLFGLHFVQGDDKSFGLPGKALIPQSIANYLFQNENPVGKNIRLVIPGENSEVEVIGVFEDLPKNTSIPNAIITSIGNQDVDDWNISQYLAYVTLENPTQAIEVGNMMGQRLESLHPSEAGETPMQIKVNNLHERYFDQDNDSQFKGSLNTTYSLIGIAVLILVIALINYVNFSLAVVPRKIKGINIKKVLGSSLLSLRMTQIAEGLGITAIASLLALLIVVLLRSTRFAGLIESPMLFRENIGIVLGTIGIALVTSVVASIYPAVYSTSFPPAMVLKGSFGLSSKGRKFRVMLIGFQYIVSLIMIICASFMYLQYRYMKQYDVGFNRDEIIMTKLSPGMIKHQAALTDKLKTNKDIADVAYSFTNLIDTYFMWGLEYKNQKIVPYFFAVTPNFTSVMGIEIKEGRDFVESDLQAPGTYIFNETAKKEFQLELDSPMQNHQVEMRAKIVGFAKDFNFKPLHYRIEPIALYVANTPWNYSYAYIKTTGKNLPQTMDFIRKTMIEFDPDASGILKVQLLDQSIGNLYQKEDNQASLMIVFSILALLIPTIGIFGLIMYEIQYRRKEIGVRKIFGGTVSDVLHLFNDHYLKVVAICFVISAPIAYYIVIQWQAHFAYKAHLSFWVFVAALSIVLLITVLTITIQCYGAANENPVKSLKSE